MTGLHDPPDLLGPYLDAQPECFVIRGWCALAKHLMQQALEPSKASLCLAVQSLFEDAFLESGLPGVETLVRALLRPQPQVAMFLVRMGDVLGPSIVPRSQQWAKDERFTPGPASFHRRLGLLEPWGCISDEELQRLPIDESLGQAGLALLVFHAPAAKPIETKPQVQVPATVPMPEAIPNEPAPAPVPAMVPQPQNVEPMQPKPAEAVSLLPEEPKASSVSVKRNDKKPKIKNH